MAIYRCEYGTVTEVGENVIQEATNMDEYVTAYDGNLKKTLSEWEESDTARPTFDKAEESIIEQAKKYAAFGKDMGEFIVCASDAINTLDTALCGLKI